jgi:hypothetical protein
MSSCSSGSPSTPHLSFKLRKSNSNSSDSNSNLLVNCDSISLNGLNYDNLIDTECSKEDLELLARLEAQNRLVFFARF